MTPPNNKPDWAKRCVIVAGAPECVSFAPLPGDYLIACDHGYDHLLEMGLAPHLLMGDFDSCRTPRPPSIPCLTVPAEKDDTDTMLAMRHGLSMGFSDFLLLGATGGRVDHFWANCSAAAFLAKHGARCEIRDARNALYAFSAGTLTLRRQPGAFLSVFSFCDTSRGVTLSGVKYPLQNATLTNDFPLGVSNEFAADAAQISLQSGLLLVMVAQA